MATEIEIGEYMGKPLLSIWTIGKEGLPEERPTISFGLKKAKAILSAIEEIEKFVKNAEGGK